MDSDRYFAIVSDITETWDKVKQIPDYETIAGRMLFERIFEIAPSAWDIFPFFKNYEPGSKDLRMDPEFTRFSKSWMRMFDLAIHMLGPDMELVETMLLDLGCKHMSYGVMPKHYPIMGRALVDTLEKILGDKFSARIKESWNIIFTFMSTTMTQGAYQSLIESNEKLKTKSIPVGTTPKPQKKKWRLFSTRSEEIKRAN